MAKPFWVAFFTVSMVPLDRGLIKATTIGNVDFEAYSTICVFRIGPAARPYLVHSAGNNLHAIL